MGEFKDQQGHPHYQGHRARLRQRFHEAGGKALPDYELLEMVLFRALPRRDTKPIAKSLLAKFETFAAVINASDTRLREVKGVGDAVITELKLIQAAALRLMQTDLSEKEILGSWSSLIKYCHAAMAHQQREQFRIIFLDKRNRIISDEVQSEGTIDHTPVYIREVVKRALDVGATAIVLLHNHPSGDPTPSRDDIKMTKAIIDALDKLNIHVQDHVIVGRDGYASLRELKLI